MSFKFLNKVIAKHHGPAANKIVYGPMTGVFVGHHPTDPSLGFITVREEDWTAKTYFVRLDELTLDPIYHYTPSMDDQVCGCGHPYKDHFDTEDVHIESRTITYYEEMTPVKCQRGCYCRRFYEPTIQNQLNRLHTRRLYTIRITRDIEIAEQIEIATAHEENGYGKPATYKKGDVWRDVSVSSYADHTNMYTVLFNPGNGEYETNSLPKDAFEVIERRWHECVEPMESEWTLEAFQPEALRIPRKPDGNADEGR